MTHCLIDDSMTTAMVAEPLRLGWVESGVDCELVPGLTAERVREGNSVALVGSIDASLLADRYTVITDVALASWHAGAVALLTPNRPDEVDNVPVLLDGISRTAEAIARATIARYFGMTITGWDRSESTGEAVVQEHENALLELESGVLTDLVHAWFILSGLPVATHLLVAPKEMIENDPEAVALVVESLKTAATTGVSRRREIRRNMHAAFPVNRDQLVVFHNEQTITLSKTARKGWLDLLRRVGRAMALPAPEEITFHTIGEPEEQAEQA